MTCESADAKEGNNDARQDVENPRPVQSIVLFEYINAEPCGGYVELVCMWLVGEHASSTEGL